MVSERANERAGGGRWWVGEEAGEVARIAGFVEVAPNRRVRVEVYGGSGNLRVYGE